MEKFITVKAYEADEKSKGSQHRSLNSLANEHHPWRSRFVLELYLMDMDSNDPFYCVVAS